MAHPKDKGMPGGHQAAIGGEKVMSQNMACGDIRCNMCGQYKQQCTCSITLENLMRSNAHPDVKIVNQIKILRDFAKKMIEGQQDMPPEFAKIMNDNLWNLI